MSLNLALDENQALSKSDSRKFEVSTTPVVANIQYSRSTSSGKSHDVNAARSRDSSNTHTSDVTWSVGDPNPNDKVRAGIDAYLCAHLIASLLPLPCPIHFSSSSFNFSTTSTMACLSFGPLVVLAAAPQNR